MTVITFDINHNEMPAEQLLTLLKDGEVLFGQGLNNRKYYDRSTSELLEKVGLDENDKIIVEACDDDGWSPLILIVRYSTLEPGDIAARVNDIDPDEDCIENWEVNKGDVEAFLDSECPISLGRLKELCDLLENRLKATKCIHTLNLTRQSCTQEYINQSKMLEWFRKEGASCDCEVLQKIARRYLSDDRPGDGAANTENGDE